MSTSQPSASPTSQTLSTMGHTESRALTLLGQGLSISVVASALGVTESTISQLLSNPAFSSEVKNRKFAALARHNTIDENYDKMETALQKKLHEVIPMMFKPREILQAIQIINGAKRRGMPSHDTNPGQGAVVPIIMPTIITQKFVTNINQQVIQAGSQDLTTLPSSEISKLASKPPALQLSSPNQEGIYDVQTSSPLPTPTSSPNVS